MDFSLWAMMIGKQIKLQQSKRLQKEHNRNNGENSNKTGRTAELQTLAGIWWLLSVGVKCAHVIGYGR